MRALVPGARDGQCGVALITALLVVAIAGILAVELVWRTNLDLRRTAGLLSWEQARQLGYGAEEFAGGIMKDGFQQLGGDPYTRDMDQDFCVQGRSVVLAKEDVLDEGGWTGHVCDLQGRFNLNNLVQMSNGLKDKVVVDQFRRRLLNAVSSFRRVDNMDPTTVDTIVDSVVDWIDPDTTAEYHGAEDDWYTSQPVPYQAANTWFTNPSELLAVKGMTPEIYEALRPYVAALPPATPATEINVNTAWEPVLMSLGDDITLENAEEWIRFNARDGPFKDKTQFTKFVDPAMLPYIGITTKYLGLQGTISIGTTRLEMYSLLEVKDQNVRVLLRTFGSIEADAASSQASSVKDDKLTKDDKSIKGKGDE